MDTDLESALATIGAAMPQEARQAHLAERKLNLAASGNALAVDLGVPGLPDEQRAATEAQVMAIATEIQRLDALAEVPLPEFPQVPALTQRLVAVEDSVDVLILDALGGSDV